jgi:hypothetical protein
MAFDRVFSSPEPRGAVGSCPHRDCGWWRAFDGDQRAVDGKIKADLSVRRGPIRGLSCRYDRKQDQRRHDQSVSHLSNVSRLRLGRNSRSEEVIPPIWVRAKDSSIAIMSEAHPCPLRSPRLELFAPTHHHHLRSLARQSRCPQAPYLAGTRTR